MRGVPRAREAIWRAPSEGHVDAEDPRRAHHDALQVLGRIEVETPDESEPVAQRAREQPCASGGADKGETGQVEPDRACRGPLADEDVELEVLHGRVQDLFDGSGQTVDLVDEQDVAVLEVGEQRSQVTGSHQGGARGDAQAHAHLRRHDARPARSCRGPEAPRTRGGRPVARAVGPPPGRSRDVR